jgi:hypothetical protein
MPLSKMTNNSAPNERSLRESAVTDRFLDDPNEDSFAALFRVFAPQLVSFFRARSRQLALAEDLAQEVMLTVYRKAGKSAIAHLFTAGYSRSRTTRCAVTTAG